MKKRTSDREINALCEALIQDFLNKKHYTNSRLIDIETFVTEYLGTRIVYETFAEEIPGRGGFLSDGTTGLHILRDGIRQCVVFPARTIVIEKA